MISIIVIPTAKIVGLNDKPMNSAKNGITIENSKYTLDLYNQLKGIRCAPKIIAITISILSGIVG